MVNTKYMRDRALLPMALVLAQAAAAQPLVTELGGGVGLQGVSEFFVDEEFDRVLLAGSFAYANGVQVSPGVLQWDSEGLASMGCGVAWDCVSFINEAGLVNRAHTITRWRDDIYLGGSFFFTRDGIEHNFIMRWDGQAWHPLGVGVDGPVKSIKVIDDELIVAGWFTYADTVLCNGLARWDGERWQRVVEVPPFYIGGGPNLVQDVVKFQDQWYIGGNLPLVNDLARWTGSEWEMIGNGITGAVSQVNKLRVYEDRLYVGGGFSQCPPTGSPTNPGSGVVAWDGSTWDALGGGTCGASNGAVLGMTWWNGHLYVAGLFDRIGDVPGGKLAKWDGQQWCMLPPLNYFGLGSPAALAVYHDSLYVGGAFVEAGGEVVNSFGKWTGGDHTSGCGTLVGIAEQDLSGSLVCYPNPAADQLHISIPGLRAGSTARLFDATGRLVLSETLRTPEQQLDVSALPEGSYVLRVDGGPQARVVIMR